MSQSGSLPLWLRIVICMAYHHHVEYSDSRARAVSVNCICLGTWGYIEFKQSTSLGSSLQSVLQKNKRSNQTIPTGKNNALCAPSTSQAERDAQ